MKTYIFYHKNCPDGFGAAFCAWKKFWENAIYIPKLHDEDLPEIPNWSDVFMLDIAFPLCKIQNILNHSNLTIIDHHISIYDELKWLKNYIFDIQSSGAVLSWKYFFPDQPVPMFLKYIQDKDLWKWELPNSKSIYSAIISYDQDFQIRNNLIKKDITEFLTEWIALERYRNKLISESLNHIHLLQIDEFTIPAINNQHIISETANKTILDYWKKFGYQLACCYFVLSDQKVKFSLRSIWDFDVLEICKRFWWWWHKNAGWFIIPIEKFNLMKIFSS